MLVEFFGAYNPVWTLATEDGGDAISFDVFCEMECKGENQVAHEPLEQGSFASYNKQASPLEIRVVLAMTGDPASQQEALDRIDELCEGTELVSLITPQQEYQSLNLESYSYRRNETSGASMLTVELALVEIRQVESAATTMATQSPTSKISAGNAKEKSNTSKVNTGKTQTKEQPYNGVLGSLFT